MHVFLNGFLMKNDSSTSYLRYYRQILIKEIGGQGQENLKKSKVLVLGAGGLGSPAIMYLAASGIGKLGIVDYDHVELSNLQRQILYNSEDLGHIKTKAAKNIISKLNPEIMVCTYNKEILTESDANIFEGYDVILDGSDSVSLKNLVARKCVKLCKTLITGSVSVWEGQIFMYEPKKSVSCYSCVYGGLSDEGNNCEHLGIVGTIAGTIGSMMATEAIKYITGNSSFLTNTLIVYDGLFNDFKKISVPKNVSCQSCN